MLQISTQVFQNLKQYSNLKNTLQEEIKPE